MPKTYDIIKHLLTIDRDMRYDDRKLIWKMFELEGRIKGGKLSFEDFMLATDFETLRRTRQKVQEDHKELGRKGTTKKETTGGKFVYHTKTPIFDSLTNTVRFM